MDFGKPKKLKILTICVLFQVLKRLEEEEGGGWHIVTDFVTRLIRPKYILKKSDRYMYIYIYIFMFVCVNVCVYVCVCMYMYYIIICIIYLFRHPFFVCIYKFSTRCILTICNLIPNFLLLNFTLNGHLSRLTPHGHLQVACTLFFVKFKFHTHWCKFFSA